MITPHLSSSRDDTGLAAEVKTRRPRAAATGGETYGAEDLPVLMCLPDLTPIRAPGVTIRVPVRGDGATTEAAAANDCVRDSQADRTPCEPILAGGVGAQANRRTGRRTRQGVPRPAPARPTGGVGQFLFAVVLAGVLFAIIVTIKEWNQTPVARTSPRGAERVGVPDIDFAQPEHAPAANVSSEQPELVPAANTFTHQVDVPTNTALETSEPVAPEAAGYADGAGQDTVSYSSYPSTGVDAVQPLNAGSAAGAAWPPAADGSPIRNADRSSADARYQQR